VTLNQLVNLLRKFASDHKQLNDFGQGDLAEISASTDQKYPLMWVYFDTTNYRANEQVYPFRIILMDLIYQDKSNELEVQSDMLQVAQDLCAFMIDNPDFDFMANKDVPMRFFTDRFTDLVAGIDMTLTVRDPKPLDRCVIPGL